MVIAYLIIGSRKEGYLSRVGKLKPTLLTFSPISHPPSRPIRNFITGLFGSFFHSSARIFWCSWKASAENSYTHGPCCGLAGSTMGRRKNASFFPSLVFLYSGGRIAPLHSGRSPFLRASARLFFCSGVVLKMKRSFQNGAPLVVE